MQDYTILRGRNHVLTLLQVSEQKNRIGEGWSGGACRYQHLLRFSHSDQWLPQLIPLFSGKETKAQEININKDTVL